MTSLLSFHHLGNPVEAVSFWAFVCKGKYLYTEGSDWSWERQRDHLSLRDLRIWCQGTFRKLWNNQWMQSKLLLNHRMVLSQEYLHYGQESLKIQVMLLEFLAFPRRQIHTQYILSSLVFQKWPYPLDTQVKSPSLRELHSLILCNFDVCWQPFLVCASILGKLIGNGLLFYPSTVSQ